MQEKVLDLYHVNDIKTQTRIACLCGRVSFRSSEIFSTQNHPNPDQDPKIYPLGILNHKLFSEEIRASSASRRLCWHGIALVPIRETCS